MRGRAPAVSQQRTMAAANSWGQFAHGYFTSDTPTPVASPFVRPSDVSSPTIDPLAKTDSFENEEQGAGSGGDAKLKDIPNEGLVHPLSATRQCTDCLWLLPFVFGLGLYAYMSFASIRDGNMTVFNALPDLNGDLCGRGVNENKTLLYFCMTQESQWGVLEGDEKQLDITHPICLEKCPSSFNTSSYCFQPSGYGYNGSYAFIQDYPTNEYLDLLCRPSKVFLKHIYDQFSHFVQTGPPVASTRAVTGAWPILSYAGLLALVSSYLFLVALGFCAHCIVLTGVIVVIVGTSGTSVYLLWCAKHGGCGLSENEQLQDAGGGLVMGAAAAFFLCLACRLSEDLEDAMSCIRFSCQCALASPTLCLLPPIVIAIRGAALGWMIYVHALIVSISFPKIAWHFDFGQEGTIWSQMHLSAWEWAALVFNLFMGIWIQGVMSAHVTFVISFVTQIWYVTGGSEKKASVPRFATCRAWYILTRYHLGSMVRAGFMAYLTAPVRIAFGWIGAASRSKDNPVGTILDGCCTCCIAVYRRCERFGVEAILDLSLRGTDYGISARRVEAAAQNQDHMFQVLIGSAWLFKVVAIGVITVTGHAVGAYFIFSDPAHLDPHSNQFMAVPELVAMTCAVVSFCVIYPFTLFFDTVTGSIVYCKSIERITHRRSIAVEKANRSCFLQDLASCHCGSRGRNLPQEEWSLLGTNTPSPTPNVPEKKKKKKKKRDVES